jgi:3-dehydroquinate synthase class II
MKNLKNIPAVEKAGADYIKALKAEIDNLTEQMEEATDTVVINHLDNKIYKMYNLIVALKKMQMAFNDIEDLEKELFND